MGPKEFKDMMDYLTRPRMADGGRIGFADGLPKNVRLTPQGQYRFSSQAGGKKFSKVFPKGTKLEEVEKFRDGYLKQFGIEEGQLRPVNPERGKYEGVKGQKHIKFNGVTYQVAVQRMKDGKMITEKPFYTTDLKEAKQVRDQRVAKFPPKMEKGVFNPDREKEQKKVESRRLADKETMGRGIKFGAPKGYQVHHLLPLTLGSPDVNTRDLAVVNAQMNREMAQFNKPINNLTKEAYLLDYNGDRKNSLKKLNKINKELENFQKQGVKKLGPKYKGLIGFNKLTPVFDENGVVINLDEKPVGVDFKKSIAKNIKVPEKVKKLPTSEVQKLVSEAPTLGMNLGLFKGFGEALRAVPTPLGTVGATAGFGVDPTSAIDRATIATEAALAPQLVKQSASFGPVAQRIFNLGLNPATAARIARFASPIGIASLGLEGLYNVGKLGLEDQRRFEALSPEEQRAERAEQEEFARGIEGAREGGIIGKKSGPPPQSGPNSQGLPGLLKRGRRI